MNNLKITAINVFIEIDGKQCIAPIDSESADMFIGMLPSFQNRCADARLITLPKNVAEKLIETRAAILEQINTHKE